MNHDRPAPTREDLFGPSPGTDAEQQPPIHAALRRALARLILGLVPAGKEPPEETARLIAALRREIDDAVTRQRQRVALHPMLEAWLPREVEAVVSISELALLVESLAAAAPADQPGWAQRILRRCGALAGEEMVALVEGGQALEPVMDAGDAPAMVPPARIRTALVLGTVPEAAAVGVPERLARAA